jgi:cation:H+ antiporter
LPPEGLGLPWAIVLFSGSAALVVAGAIAIARAADDIAKRTGLGGMLVGMLLLAGVTSLPEMVINVAATLNGQPDLAIGDLFGASMANMATLALLNVVHRGRVWPRMHHNAGLGLVAIMLTVIPVLAILVPPAIGIGWLGIESVAIVAGYVLAVALLQRGRIPAPMRQDPTRSSPGQAGAGVTPSTRRVLLQFSTAAAVILVAAPVLAVSAGVIADETALGETFVGTLLIALATSLPELTASFTAVRLGAFDLAAGNLFGSNAFNMTAVLAADAAWTDGPVLAAVDRAQVVAGLGAIFLMGANLFGIARSAARLPDVRADHARSSDWRRTGVGAPLVLGSYVVILAMVLEMSR